MVDKKPSINLITSAGTFLFLFIVLVALLAWIIYGTLEGVLATLSYLIVGIICCFPWLIPFIGIPLGILDVLGIFGFNIYTVSLNIARLSGSWLSVTWYWLISILGMGINLILMLRAISWFKGIKHRKKEPKTNYALINCNIIDGNRGSEIISNGVILIKNIVEEDETPGLITVVGTINEINIPLDYKIVDLKGKYILPGLINAHCHLFGNGKPMKLMGLSDKYMEKLAKILDTPFGRRFAKNRMKKNAITALNAGVTTLRTMGDPFYLDVKIRKKVEKGKFLGPRLLVAGYGLCPTGGHGGLLGFIADDTGEIRKRIRKNVREEVDHIKILSTGGVMDARMIGEAGRPQMTIEEIETACFEAHRGGLLVATHCESTEGMKEALLGGVDSIEHGAEIADELIPLFKENPKSLRGYTIFTPTISAGMALSTLPIKKTKINPIKLENAKLIERGMILAFQKAYKRGIRFSCGTDASVPYSTHYGVWKELKYYMKYSNMTAQEAIYYATKNTAENIGIGKVTGSIEVGKSADLQIVPGNPLENIDILGKVEMVIIKGNIIKNPRFKKVNVVESTPLEPLEI
ncbi:MAG: amidohydrolase family protein [Promethearchaeota archaeon]